MCDALPPETRDDLSMHDTTFTSMLHRSLQMAELDIVCLCGMLISQTPDFGGWLLSGGQTF
jgi:hypothetical protein